MDRTSNQSIKLEKFLRIMNKHLSYKELVNLGYGFEKSGSLYQIFAPDGKSLGFTSEKREAKQWAVRHYNKKR